MKMFGKNEDRVIDNLLRANTRGRSGTPTACREFDPDLANAYIERSLTASERAGYEGHLSECHACRSSMVALARIAAAEAAPSVLAQPARAAGRFETLKSLFTTPAMPRVAAAALALIVLAISIPLLISRKDSTSSPAESSSEVLVGQSAKSVDGSPVPPSAPAPINGGSNALPGMISQQEPMPRAKAEQDKPDAAQGDIALSRPSPAEPDAAAATGARAVRTEPPQTEKLEASRAAESSYQERKTESDARLIAKDQQPAPPPPAPEAQRPLGQINPDVARRLPQKDNDAASMTIQRGKSDGAPGAERQRAIRPADAVAPPSQSEAAGSGPQRGLAAPSPRATSNREDTNSSALARGSTMRKVGSKKFWLSKDTWTDKDYNASKEMPVVTVERDSDIYKELLTKRSGLKLYLMSFGESERAIFVYKGTVYKLIPQNSR